MCGHRHAAAPAIDILLSIYKLSPIDFELELPPCDIDIELQPIDNDLELSPTDFDIEPQPIDNVLELSPIDFCIELPPTHMELVSINMLQPR